MGWKERRSDGARGNHSGGARGNRSGGARSNRGAVILGDKTHFGDALEWENMTRGGVNHNTRPKDLLVGRRAVPHDHNEQITSESDIGRRFKGLEEKGSSKHAGHCAVKAIEIPGQTCDRRAVILEDKTHFGDASEWENMTRGGVNHNTRAAIREHDKTHFGDASERENMTNRVNHNTRPNDLLAGSRAGSHDHYDICSKQIAKESDIGKRFKSLEEKGNSKSAGHFYVMDIDIEGQTCDRRCRCVDAALDRRYFDQPFACIHCHGSVIQSLVDYIEWNPITEAFVPPGDAYGDVFVDAGINIRVIL
ncbi:uncharacterized protein [Triticum aestivum]|uniref:uncharacterized protein isoform X2 n=1 Tax=Triticum aestivum TaxID=4565 RepID=UPI000989D306|nr:uncharacterized protein LOC109763986 isoform X2 [Aegilops tauschii subsp. strangulata]XP_044330295.1 uncharacterized protein LOC123051478 isoform X2 [Triticum aestivum]